MQQTAFSAIADVIKPGMTMKQVRKEAKVSNGTVLAYLKREKVAK
ncbi:MULTISPECIES: hypothetical protein [Leptolyngbya]|nr:hypothetical protein [Leptolyngbya sp. FACHB-1624]